jgi:diaminopimelate epimerase
MAERVTVRVPGGDLFVRAGPRTFELAGPAEYAFQGTIA